MRRYLLSKETTLPRTILFVLVAALAGLVGHGSCLGQVDSKSPRKEGALEIPAILWQSYTRPNGSTGFWDPKPVIGMDATLLNVLFSAQDKPDRVVYGGALHPPKLLAEVLANCRPELTECHQHGVKVIGFANTIWFHPDMLKTAL